MQFSQLTGRILEWFVKNNPFQNGLFSGEENGKPYIYNVELIYDGMGRKVALTKKKYLVLVLTLKIIIPKRTFLNFLLELKFLSTEDIPDKMVA